MKVTFDSNAWESIVDGRTADCINIRSKVVAGLIEPYICEISLSLESIQKAARSKFFEGYSPKFESSDAHSSSPHSVAMTVSVAPNNEAHPGLHPKLAQKLKSAENLGFRVLRMTNLGTVRASGIPNSMYVGFGTADDYWEYAERVNDCSNYIESLGCGAAEYMRYGSEYQLSRGLNKAIPESESKRFTKAVAEWCDGDAISAHYASGNAYFCTDDQAKGAGQKSVFSPSNLVKIRDKFGIQCISTGGLNAPTVSVNS